MITLKVSPGLGAAIGLASLASAKAALVGHLEMRPMLLVFLVCLCVFLWPVIRDFIVALVFVFRPWMRVLSSCSAKTPRLPSDPFPEGGEHRV